MNQLTPEKELDASIENSHGRSVSILDSQRNWSFMEAYEGLRGHEKECCDVAGSIGDRARSQAFVGCS